MGTCDSCGLKNVDVYAVHTFEDGSTWDWCKDVDACIEQIAWNDRPCCGPDGGCEGCTPMWVLEERFSRALVEARGLLARVKQERGNDGPDDKQEYDWSEVTDKEVPF